MPRLGPEGAIVVPVAITDPATGRVHRGIARVDTGADRTVVAIRVMREMGIAPRGHVTLIGVTGAPEQKPVYRIGIAVPGSGSAGVIDAVGDDMAGLGYDALIGVDVLRTGVLIYDGASESFELILGAFSPACRTGLWQTVAAAGLMGAGTAGMIWALAGR